MKFTGICAVLAGVALLCAPAGHADSQSFLTAVGPLGYTDPTNTLRNGYTVCVLRTESDSGFTSRAIRRLLMQLGRDTEATNSDEFVALAVANLCPELAR